jgi:uncharacterized damage-inducible protein DinB
VPKRIWFERKFALGVPVEAVPDIIERLRGTPLRLEDRVAAADPGIWRERKGEHWSIQEQAGHLLDLEDLWLGRLDDFDSGAETLRAADLLNRATWDADHNAESMELILAGFRMERKRFVARLEAMDDEALSRTALHPRLEQLMTVADLAFFVAEHDDHHLAVITEMIRASDGGRTRG